MSTLTKTRVKKTARKVPARATVVTSRKVSGLKNLPPGAIKLGDADFTLMGKLGTDCSGPDSD